MSEPAAIVLLEAGDAAWWAGERGDARRAWRAALAAADETPVGRAAEVMARVRLLKVSGNLGPFVHEARIDRALAACPQTEPWCAIAQADWNLYMPAFVGANPRRVPALLADNPLPEAEGRRDRAADGVRPPDPGTWVIGLGLSGAPGAGVGATARYLNPDLFWKADRLDLSANLDSLGGRGVQASLTTHGDVAWQVSGTAARTVGYAWFAGDPTAFHVDLDRLSTGVAWRQEGLAVQLGAGGRTESTGALRSWVGGPYLVGTVASEDASARVVGELNTGSYTHLFVSVDLRASPAVGEGTLAVRVSGAATPLAGTPFYRLPEAGGSTLLRGAPAGRWRDTTLLAAQVELRHPIWGPLEGALFVDSAHVEGWHATAGGGIRIVLPPGKMNTTRLDLGIGPDSWGVVAGWGEAF